MGARLGAEGQDRSPEPRSDGAAPMPLVAGWEKRWAASSAPADPPPGARGRPRAPLAGARRRLGRCSPAWRWVPSVPPWPLPRPAWDLSAPAAGAGASQLRGVGCALSPLPGATPPPEAAGECRAGRIAFISPISHYIRPGPYLRGASLRPPGRRAFSYARGRACPRLPASVCLVLGGEGP